MSVCQQAIRRRRQARQDKRYKYAGKDQSIRAAKQREKLDAMMARKMGKKK